MTETKRKTQPTGHDAPSPDAVRRYLLEHPDFLLQHPDALRAVNLTGDDSMSLVQRQVQQMRDELAAISTKMELASQYAEHSRAQMQQLCDILPVLAAEDSRDGLLDALARQMQQVFGLPSCHLLRVGDGPVQMDPDALDTLSRLCGRDGTFCGRLPALETRLVRQAVDSAPCTLDSVALVAMPCNGMLLLGSDDEARFAGDMARDFICLVAAVLSALLRRAR